MSQSQFSPPNELPILLIFLTPKCCEPTCETDTMALLKSIQDCFRDQIQLLYIDSVTHPFVASSFKITQIPTCILLRNGAELWRQAGMLTENTIEQIAQKL